MTHSRNLYTCSMKVYVEKKFNIFFIHHFLVFFIDVISKHILQNITYSKKYNFIDFKFVRWVRLLTPGGYFWCFCFLYFRHLWSNASRSIIITLFIHIQIGECFLAEYLTVYCSCLTDSLNISHLLKIFTYTDKPSVIYMRRKSSKFVRNAREELLKYITKN